MAKLIGFSEITTHFKDKPAAGEYRYCLADTNFVVSCLHGEHTFWTPSKKFFKDAANVGFVFFVTHTSRTEFLDIERKFSLTRPLVELYREEGKWKGKIKACSKTVMEEPVSRVIKSKEGFEFFSDFELKNIKETFFPYNESGKVGWINFCEEFLSSKLSEAWDNICKDIGLNYLKIREEEDEIGKPGCLVNKKVDWADLISLVGRTGMGTSDAMIANAFLVSKFEVLVTTDLDLAYGLCADLDDSKFVAIPDNMIKSNKFLFQKILAKKQKKSP